MDIHSAAEAAAALERAKPMLNMVEAYDRDVEGWELYHNVIDYLRELAEPGGEPEMAAMWARYVALTRAGDGESDPAVYGGCYAEARKLLDDILAADPHTPPGIATQARAAFVWLTINAEPLQIAWALPHLRRIERWAALEPDPFTETAGAEP